MAAEAFDAGTVRRLRAPLLRWYRRAKRDLPWRRTTDPYAIWVSEVMLQQTTVAAVIPYWSRFLDRFPDLQTLASAREEDVLASWTGLGYYRRARALREGAIAVMERHAGRVPEDADALLALPGVGRYTAGAIASLAFGRQAPVVDGNVKRVFARLFALRGTGASAEKAYWRIAETLVRGVTPGDLNQAVMELGATVCTPRAPRCPSCPVSKACRSFASGTAGPFPAAAARKRARAVAAAVAWIEKNGRVLLEGRRDDGLLRGTWDLPAVALARGEDPCAALTRALRSRRRLNVRCAGEIARVKHAILDTRLSLTVVRATLTAAGGRKGLRWQPLARLDDVPTSSATTKIARAVSAQKRSQDSRGTGASSSSGSSSGSRGRAKA